MLTRRRFMAASIAAAGALRAGASFARAAQPATPVSFEVPRGACDCHTHIHGDSEKFPFFPGRVYTPEMALPEEMAALHLVVTLNGTRTVDVLDHKLSRGPIALQYGAGVVKFRKVEIKPL